MSAGISASFSVIICFLVRLSGAQKIIRHEKITADHGQNVILPCKVPNKYNINTTAVEWSRPDQGPEYVLSYRDGHIDPDNQHPSYQNRVDLQDKEMKDGDISLILKNVKMEDNGTYMCRVFEKRKNEPISNITLEVRPPVQEIPAELGQDVILPCKAPNNINNISVEWRRPGQDPEYVLLYRDGRLDPHNQHPSYQNRVDLQDKEMKDGNVSLILKNVMKNDTGKFQCRVFEKGKKYPIIIINLEVYPPGDRDGIIGDGGDKDGEDLVGITVGSVVVVCVILLALLSARFLIYGRPMKQNQNYQFPSVEQPAVLISTVPKSPAEPPTASEALMEPAAVEQTEM